MGRNTESGVIHHRMNRSAMGAIMDRHVHVMKSVYQYSDWESKTNSTWTIHWLAILL